VSLTLSPSHQLSDTSSELAAAAELAGSLAHGEVAAAIRAKAAVRLARAQATRQASLLNAGRRQHLASCDRGNSGADAALRPWDAEEATSARATGSRSLLEEEWVDDDLPHGMACGSGAADLTAAQTACALGVSFSRYRSTPEPEAPPRIIRVAQKTTLGRMVQADPERAAKYGLVAVPSWQKNLPWPPPPVPLKPRPRRKKDHARVKAKMPEERPSSRHRESTSTVGMSKGLKRMTIVVNTIRSVRKCKTRNSMASRRSRASDVCRFASVESVRDDRKTIANIQDAYNRLTNAEIAFFTDIFNRHSAGTGGVLTRKQINAAFRTAGITESSSAREQMLFKHIQEVVLEHLRPPEDEDDPTAPRLPNPLTSRDGIWLLEEFLMVMAGVFQHKAQERSDNLKTRAEQLAVSVDELLALEQAFAEYEDDSKRMNLSDLQLVLNRSRMSVAPAELRNLLGTITNSEADLGFEDFVRVMVSLSDMLRLGDETGGGGGDENDAATANSGSESEVESSEDGEEEEAELDRGSDDASSPLLPDAGAQSYRRSSGAVGGALSGFSHLRA